MEILNLFNPLLHIDQYSVRFDFKMGRDKKNSMKKNYCNKGLKVK